MDLKQLYTFRTVATLGSFNQAADVLNYAQSTVSDQVKALEEDLDIKLFNRDGRQISLTPEGELFLQYAQKMINLEEEVRTEIKGSGEVYGSLSIRIPETIGTYYLPPALKIFRSRYPHVDFVFNSCSCLGLREELRSGIINLAFLITRDFRDANLEIQDLLEVPLVLVTYPDNPIAAKSSVKLGDLKNEVIFVTSSDCNYYNVLEGLFSAEKITPSSRYRMNSIEAIKRNISAGTGAALLSRIAVRTELSNGTLVELPYHAEPLTARMVMIRLKNKWHPPILETFMDIVKESITSNKWP